MLRRMTILFQAVGTIQVLAFLLFKQLESKGFFMGLFPFQGFDILFAPDVEICYPATE